MKPLNIWISAVLGLLLFSTGLTAAQPPTPEALRQMNNEQLLAAYETFGLSLAGSYNAPTVVDLSSTTRTGTALALIGPEVVRRGRSVVPALLAFLKREIPTSRGLATSKQTGISFTGDIINMLLQIRDPAAVPVILHVLDGWDGKAQEPERRVALDALEKLTYVCFHHVKPFWNNYQDALEHPRAQPVDYFEEFETPARLYHEWLAGEGKRPAEWLNRARKRAWTLLLSDDLQAIYCAAYFLRPRAGRDKNESHTIARLAEIIGAMEHGSHPYYYLYKGTQGEIHIGNWTELLSEYGPRARPKAQCLLRLLNLEQNGRWITRELAKIGGTEVVERLVQLLPECNAQVLALDKRLAVGSTTNLQERELRLDTQAQVRWGIDRWAGRSFESDGERITWWQANRSKPPQRWLEDNLPLLVKQADEGTSLSPSYLARQILPDLPRKDFPKPVNQTGVMEKAFFQQWLNSNRRKLWYDAASGTFRLGSANQAKPIHPQP